MELIQFLYSGAGNSENWFCVQIVTIVLCLIVLMMPTEGNASQSIIPPLFHFSTAFKNVASFILGRWKKQLY